MRHRREVGPSGRCLVDCGAVRGETWCGIRRRDTGRGIGRRLLEGLIRRCEGLGYRQMIAVIGDSANAGSIGVHAACGFLRVGTLRSAGFKFGRWVDSVFMQRPLGPGDSTRP